MHDIHDVLNLVIADFGGARITLGRLLVAILVIVACIAVARMIVHVLRRLRSRLPNGGTALYVLEKLGSYGLILLGTFLALSVLGINLSSLAVFAGALGVGAGLGLQGVVKEFVSGLVLLFDSIVAVGDFIELPGSGGVRGIVHEIGARATRIRTNDNVDVLVPNSRLIEERFVNWTLEGKTRRIHIPFSVAYGVDKAQVRDVVLAAADTVEATIKDDATHRSQVWLVGFGDFALNFELVVWPRLEAVKRPGALTAAYLWAIDDALRAAGIEIPFPQRDIRIRSMFGHEGEDGLNAFVQSPKPAKHSRNDAAHDLERSEDPPPNPRRRP